VIDTTLHSHVQQSTGVRRDPHAILGRQRDARPQLQLAGDRMPLRVQPEGEHLVQLHERDDRLGSTTKSQLNSAIFRNLRAFESLSAGFSLIDEVQYGFVQVNLPHPVMAGSTQTMW